MEGRRTRLSYFVGHPLRRNLQSKRHETVRYVTPLQGFTDDIFIRFGILKAMTFDQSVDQRKMQFWDHKTVTIRYSGCKKLHLMSATSQF